MLILRSEERGKGEFGWLHTRYSFSFADYFNPEKMNFGALRVLNEDWIEPAQGFDMHPHRNMEIVTMVLEGALKHKDSLGNQGVIHAREVQRMSAGTGIIHSEFNHSQSEPVHLLQIWILPKVQNIQPNYEKKSFKKEKMKNRLLPVVSGEKKDDALFIHQDSTFFLSELEGGISLTYSLSSKNHGAYLFVIDGKISLKKTELSQGDAAAITETEPIKISSLQESKILLIDVPGVEVKK